MKNRILRRGDANRNKIIYELYDSFTTPLVTGIVNNTYTDSIDKKLTFNGQNQKRTVTDTESKLSIANGVLTFAGGKATPAGGDPTLWYPSITRVLGRALMGIVTPSNASQIFSFGFDANQTGNPSSSYFDFGGNGSGKIACLNNGSGAIVATFSVTTYQLALVLRATGAFFYIKGGSFTVWTLIDIISAGNTATIFPIILGYNAVFTADNLRIPSRLFIPVPLASDGFSLASTTDGLGHAEANGGAGLTWTGATWTVAGGSVSNAPTQGAELVTNGNFSAWTADNPDGWSLNTAETGALYVTQNPSGQCQLVSDGASFRIQQTILSVGSWYSGSIDIKALASGTLGIFDDGFGIVVSYSTTGVKPFSLRAKGTIFGVSRVFGATDITFDDVSVKPLTLSTLFRSLQISTPDVLAEVEITRTAGTQAGLVLNLDSAATPANFIIVYENVAGSIVVDECVAGVYTNKQTTAVTYVAGAVLRVVRYGTSLDVYYNNAKVGSTLTMTANTNTLHGLFDTYGNTFDNFCLWARGTEGQWEGLSNL